MVRMLIVLSVFACGAPARAIAVRMGEHRERTNPTVASTSENEYVVDDPFCRIEGAPRKDLFEPVVEFARKNLLPRKLAPDAPVRVVRGTRDGHRFQQGAIEIEVNVRQREGELRVALGAGTWSPEWVYCLHTIDESDATTVIVEPDGVIQG